MGHGEHVAVNDTKMPDDYYCNVRKDVQELRKLYPFVYFIFLPLRNPKPVVVHVIAADCTLIEKLAHIEKTSYKILVKNWRSLSRLTIGFQVVMYTEVVGSISRKYPWKINTFTRS